MKFNSILAATLAMHASVSEASQIEADSEFFLRDLFSTHFGYRPIGSRRPTFGSFGRYVPPPPPPRKPLVIISKLVDDFIGFAGRIRLGPGRGRGLGLRKRRTNKFITKRLIKHITIRVPVRKAAP